MDENSAYGEIRGELSIDESLLWSGTPKKGFHFSGQRAYFMIFGAVFLGFAIFWVIGATRASGFFGLFGIPFVLAGLYLIFGRALSKMHSVYGVTDRRIIIKTMKTTVSIPFSSIRSLTKRNFSDGSGDITIITNETVSTRYGYSNVQRIMQAVPDVDRVYKIINDNVYEIN